MLAKHKDGIVGATGSEDTCPEEEFHCMKNNKPGRTWGKLSTHSMKSGF